MADGQSLSSRSEADRMIVGLEFRSESDLANDGAANETDRDSRCSPAKQVVGSPRSRSEQPGKLQSEGGGDMVENVCRGSERSVGGVGVSANCDCAGAEENQAEDNPLGVQGVDEDCRVDDGHAEKRLGVEDEAEDKGLGETNGASGENVREDRERAAQTVTRSIEQGEVDLKNVMDDDPEAVPQREACSPGHGHLGEESESKSGLDAKTCLERSDTVGMDVESDGEPVSHCATRSPVCSIPFEMSETFLDNMNPQDDSQDLEEQEEDRGMDVEEDEHKAAKEDIESQESSAVSESQNRTLEHSLDFELSETFLDNLNPQDDSQDFGEVCEEKATVDEHKATEIESKDSSDENKESVILESTGSASEDKVASSLQRDETMELAGDSVLEAVSQRTASSPEHSLPFELSETFLDNLNPQDNSQDMEEEEEMEEKEGERSVSDTDKEDVPSSLEREESAGEGALPHIPSDTAGSDEPASSAQQNVNADEISSPCPPQTPADEMSSFPVHQDATSHEAASLRTQPEGAAGDEVSSPGSGRDSSEDRATLPQDEPQSGDKEVEERDCDQVMTDDEASSLPGQKRIAASDDDAAVECAAAEESSCEQNVPPEKVLPLSVGKDASPSEDSAVEGGSPTTEAHDGISDEMTSIQDVKDDSSSSPVDTGKVCVGHEEAAVNSPEEDLHALPLCEEGKEEESSANVDDDDDDDNAREEGEYSSSPSSSPERDDVQDENASDVLQLSASDDVDVRDEGTDKRKGKVKNFHAVRNARPQEKVCAESSHENHFRNSDGLNGAVVVDVNSDCEDDFRNFQDKLKKEKPEKEDENSVSNANVDSSVRDDSDTTGASSQEPSSQESPAVGVTVVTENGDGEIGEEEGERTLVANDDNSDDDVQIIEGPPQEPIDTLIVDDDDDDDVVPSSTVTSKPPVSESSRTSKKKRTVEQDGHDLRIVVRDERREKEDSDRRHRRHERDRREERRSHSHRRSELDRKSSDRSSRRRHHRSRSHSRERRRRRSRSRSHSRDRASRRRRPRDRSREKSAERERSSHRKRRRDRSHEHRHRSRSRSRSPKHSREDSWDKENRDDRENSRSKRRRHHRDGDKRRESQEEERSGSKYQDSSLSSKQSRASRPSNNFTKDSSDSPSAAEKSEEEEDSDGSVKEVVQNARPSVQSTVPADKPDKPEENSKKETEVMPVDIPIPEPQDIPIPKPEDIPIPETEHIPVPPPFSIPVPQPELLPGPPVFSVLLPPPHPVFENPPLPPPEEEPRENPPEPPPLPPRWPEVLPTKGEGLLPTPIRRKAALEEAAAAAVYDPAHPTDDDGERFRFPGVPNSAHPPPEMLAGPPPRLQGQVMADGTFVPTPGEGGLLGPPPQRVPMQPVRFGPPRPVMVNHVVMERPPFTNGPFPSQLAGPPLPPRFPIEIAGPGGVVPLQGQFGQGPPPPGPLPPPQGFPGQLNDRFEEGGPPVGQFPVSVPSGVADMANMAAPPPPGLPPPPPDLHLLTHAPPPDLPMAEKPGADEGFDKALAKLVMAQSLLVMERKAEEEGAPLPASSAMFKVPPPPRLDLPAGSPGRCLPSAEAAVSVEQLEDSTEVMDMDMSPLEEECELRMSSPSEEAGGEQEKSKKLKPLAAIDLRAISNAILQLTSAATDDVPASAVELTNKEKYMKKLHLQERVVDEVKQALRPFYIYKKINKEEYKTILRKAVPKVCHSKSGDINPQKIQQLVEGYVDKFNKQRQHTEQKVKPPAKPASPKEKGKANGERAKPAR